MNVALNNWRTTVAGIALIALALVAASKGIDTVIVGGMIAGGVGLVVGRDAHKD